MCEGYEDMDNPFILNLGSISINWNGWTTNSTALQTNGWLLTRRPAYKNWRDPINSDASNDYLYLHHPETHMLARLKRNVLINGAYELDFMLSEKAATKTLGFLGARYEEKNKLKQQIHKLEHEVDKLNTYLNDYEEKMSDAQLTLYKQYGEEDIDFLLETILAIQNKRPKVKKSLPSTIISFPIKTVA